jgi:hypothetical protein
MTLTPGADFKNRFQQNSFETNFLIICICSLQKKIYLAISATFFGVNGFQKGIKNLRTFV